MMSNNKNVFTLSRNKTIILDDNIKITFLYHSHKKTLVDGPPSPLIVYIKYEKMGYEKEVEYHLETNYSKLKTEKVGWEWNNLYFILTEYRYNDFMNVEIYKNLPVEYEYIFKD